MLLRQMGALIVEKSYVHSYPHCWRCRNPLIYRAITSWYVKVTEFKDRMSELNEQINWIPENVKYGQFGKWVENASRLVNFTQPFLGFSYSRLGFGRSKLSPC